MTLNSFNVSSYIFMEIMTIMQYVIIQKVELTLLHIIYMEHYITIKIKLYLHRKHAILNVDQILPSFCTMETG